jgi:glycosyltransferase involved in cell wall biosynthesis
MNLAFKRSQLKYHMSSEFVESHFVENPEYSFIVPAHNEEHFLAKSLESIHEAAKKLVLDYELIVVNDASTDRTALIADSMFAQRVDVNLRKISAVRNAGAKMARGQYLIFLDADTVLPLETLKSVLREFKAGAIGGGAYVTVDPPLTLSQKFLIWTFCIGWQVICGWAAGCFMFMRRDAFLACGGFDENYYAAEELYLSREIKKRGRFVLVKPPVITSGRKLRAHSTWKFMKWALPTLLSGPERWKKKEGLDILYDSKRDVL